MPRKRFVVEVMETPPAPPAPPPPAPGNDQIKSVNQSESHHKETHEISRQSLSPTWEQRQESINTMLGQQRRETAFSEKPAIKKPENNQADTQQPTFTLQMPAAEESWWKQWWQPKQWLAAQKFARQKRRSGRKPLGILLLALFFLLFLPGVFGIVWISSWWSGWEQLQVALQERDVEQVLASWDKIKSPRQVFAYVNQSAPSVAAMALQTTPDEVARLLRVLEALDRLVVSANVLQNSGSALLPLVIGGEAGPVEEPIQEITSTVASLQTDLSVVESELKALSLPPLLSGERELIQEALVELPKWRRQLQATEKILTQSPTLLGLNEKQTYLVLLQNNQELRGTGGFIGSFALVTMEKGKLLDFQVEDVYEADGQLKGFVEPPAELKEFLGEAQWFLRDVNWSADFPTVAQQAVWFLDKTIGVRPTGVVGVNLYVLEPLLRAIGPIKVPDFDEVVTADNLALHAERYSEVNFFAGSTQKRDFLSAFATALFVQLEQQPEKLMAALPALLEAGDTAQLTMWSSYPELEAALAGLGWDGSIRTPPCPPPLNAVACQTDSVMQVELNVGVNKANEFVERTTKHEVLIADAVIQHRRTMVIRNKATTAAWPAGAYRTFLRLYVPSTAVLNGIAIDGQTLADTEVRRGNEGVFNWFGARLEVPMKSEKTIVIEYSLPRTIADERWAYTLFEQKQSGVADDPISHQITADGWRPLTVSPQPTSLSPLLFEGTNAKHRLIGLELAK